MFLDQIRMVVLCQARAFLAGGMKSIRNKHVYRCGVGQRVVFEEEFIIHFGHSVFEHPSHVLGSPSSYEPCCRHCPPLAGKAENASYLLFFPYTPFGSLAAGVHACNLDSSNNSPRVTGKVIPSRSSPWQGQGLQKDRVPGRAVVLRPRNHPVSLCSCS